MFDEQLIEKQRIAVSRMSWASLFLSVVAVALLVAIAYNTRVISNQTALIEGLTARVTSLEGAVIILQKAVARDGGAN